MCWSDPLGLDTVKYNDPNVDFDEDVVMLEEVVVVAEDESDDETSDNTISQKIGAPIIGRGANDQPVGKVKAEKMLETIDLSKTDAGIKMVKVLREFFIAKDAAARVGGKSPTLYIHELVDITTALSNTWGFGSITNSTSGYRMIGNENMKITIWFRKNLDGSIKNDSDNEIDYYTTQLGKENPSNGRIYTNIIIRNGSGKGVIRFEISTKNNQAAINQNVEYIQKLRSI